MTLWSIVTRKGRGLGKKGRHFRSSHVDQHHSNYARTRNIIQTAHSLLRFVRQKHNIYYSDICTSSSLPPGGAGPDAEVEAVAEAGGGGGSLGCIDWRYASIGVPSRIRKSTDVPAGSCTLRGPRMPIEVLFVVSSLSCCNVSRSACNPCRISSSRLPVKTVGIRVWDHRTQAIHNR